MPDLDRIMNSISLRIKRVIFPKLRYSQNLYEEIVSDNIKSDTIWLDLGCGHQVFPEWRTEQEKALIGSCSHVVGIDYDLISLQKHSTIKDLLRGDIEHLPFRDSSFNLITSSMVMEHVKNPRLVFKEINRILMPGGKFIFHTPNRHGYNTLAARMIPEFIKPPLVKLLHGRSEEDTFSTHYQCNTEKQIIAHTQSTGLKVHRIRYILSTPQFMIFPPLAFLEFLCLRILSTRLMRKLRINILVVLECSKQQN
jgi:ubiquinone/menaquinone biosynthesis C-methylase UbiE